MTFTDNDKLKALAIVHIFETSKPFGDYAACVVLNDGAGISYGINQFTHRSGSLLAVVEAYVAGGGTVGAAVIGEHLPLLRRRNAAAIRQLAASETFKKALRAAAVTSEMKTAQNTVALKRYLKPAIEICAERGFVLPLSLAVVYDSITHGSWERIAARVTRSRVGSASKDAILSEEKTWIMEYVQKRHFWLANIRRLKATTYRTKFFLGEIASGNWGLRLPLAVHGVKLKELSVEKGGKEDAETQGHGDTETKGEGGAETRGDRDAEKSVLESAGEAIGSAVEKFDCVDDAVTAIVTRKDAAKSLWTTVIGTIWQAAWAVIGFVIGLPKEVWVVVAVIAAALMFLFLYRQITLGKIRELKGGQVNV